jgi:heptosyltransferase-2
MEGQPHSPPAASRHILIRGTNWLGDAVMTTPALLRLREKFPDAHIAILTPEKLEQLWLHHPAVNESISFSPVENIFTVAIKLQARKFDTALVLPNSPRSALEIFLAGIPHRIGYARPWRNFFLTRALPPRLGAVAMQKRSVTEIKQLVGKHGNPEPSPSLTKERTTLPGTAHQVHEYLHLAAALGASPEPLPAQLFVTPEEIEAARKKFRLEDISTPIFGLNPGAEYGPAKRWPIEKFIAAAKEIQRLTNCTWLLFGGKNDRDLTSQIQFALGGGPAALNFAGQTSLRELMCLLKLCRMFATNDTGPMHVAAALSVPVVAIFGSTAPEYTAPLPANESLLKILRSDAPCSPCFLRECPIDFRCMNGIAVERVVKSVVEMLNR